MKNICAQPPHLWLCFIGFLVQFFMNHAENRNASFYHVLILFGSTSTLPSEADHFDVEILFVPAYEKSDATFEIRKTLATSQSNMIVFLTDFVEDLTVNQRRKTNK
jgi:hypothetical protein